MLNTICPRSSDPFYKSNILYKMGSLLLGHTVQLTFSNQFWSILHTCNPYICRTVCASRAWCYRSLPLCTAHAAVHYTLFIIIRHVWVRQHVETIINPEYCGVGALICEWYWALLHNDAYEETADSLMVALTSTRLVLQEGIDPDPDLTIEKTRFRQLK